MKKQMVFIIVLSGMVSLLFSQTPPNTLWTKTFGVFYEYDESFSVQQTTDGGYIFAGFTWPDGASSFDFWLVKTDENGNEEWNQTYGGSSDDYAYSVQQTTDGGYIIAGYTQSYGAGREDFWLVKTDENGNEEWNQTYGGSENDYAFSVQQTTDGGYIIAGVTASHGAGREDFWLVKTDENGNEEWNQTHGGSENDVAWSVQQTTDGGYIIAGYTKSYGAGRDDFWLVKTNENGNEEWNQTYGGSGGDGAHSVQQTTDGGYIIAGFTWSYGAGLNDFWLVKTDENGNEEWNQTYGGSSEDYANSVQQTTDGGFIIAGETGSYGAGRDDFWLVKTDENGNEEWNQTYGGSENDYAFSVKQTTDGGYIIVGITQSYGDVSYDIWLIRVAPETGEVRIKDNLSTIPSFFFLNQNYPNPFNPVTTISYQLPKSAMVNLAIYNVTGQLVQTLVNAYKNAGYYLIEWNARGFSSGLYFYRIEAGEYAETKRCLILK